MASILAHQLRLCPAHPKPSSSEPLHTAAPMRPLILLELRPKCAPADSPRKEAQNRGGGGEAWEDQIDWSESKTGALRLCCSTRSASIWNTWIQSLVARNRRWSTEDGEERWTLKTYSDRWKPWACMMRSYAKLCMLSLGFSRTAHRGPKLSMTSSHRQFLRTMDIPPQTNPAITGHRRKPMFLHPFITGQ